MSLNSSSSVSMSLSGSIVIAAGSIKEALESIQLCWLELLLVCTLLVGIGVVAEEWLEHASEDHRWTVAPEWHKTLARIGWILVILGVIGEGIFEAGIFFADRKLQEYNDTLLAITTDQAHNAAASAKTAHEEAEAAGKDAKKAQNDANAADATARDAEGKAAKLKNELSTAEGKLADVDKKRAELEKSLRNLATCTSPRDIPVWSFFTKQKGGHRFNESLLPFHGWSVLIEYVPNDAETLRAAFNIAKAFRAAQWNVSPPKAMSPKPDSEPFDGVEVQYLFPSMEELSSREPSLLNAAIGSSDESKDVAAKVVVFLHSYNWQANIESEDQGDADRHVIPRHGIRINVGLHPPVWYVAPPAMKDVSAYMAQLQKERAEKEQKAEQARKESDAKILSTLTPQMAEIIRKDFETNETRREQERESDLQLRTSPCQPLETIEPYN
jgi:hypothetical protein